MYRVIESTVISEPEYVSRATDIDKFFKARASSRGVASPLTFSNGRELRETEPEISLGDPAFKPMGPNLPLTILIQHVYTGKYPERGAFGHRGDMAIVSGVRNFSAADATARALNYLQSEVTPYHHFSAPDTFDQGTNVILYCPAVVTSAVTFSIEMAFANTFAQDLITSLSSAFGSAAQIPIFLPYAGYLLGGSGLLKLASDVVGALYQSSPAFLRTEVVNISLPGEPLLIPGYAIICNDNLKASDYTYISGKGLFDKNNNPYTGDEPYIVVSIDGSQEDDLKGFAPQAASASALQRFFQVTEGSETVVSDLVQGVTLANDLIYRKQADALADTIQKLSSDPTANKTEIAEYTAERQAAIANIMTTQLKPSN